LISFFVLYFIYASSILWTEAASSPIMVRSTLTGVVLLGGLCVSGLVLPYQPVPDDILTKEGVKQPARPLLASLPSGGALSTSGWTVTADSAEAGNAAALAIDGNSNTFWHSEYSPKLVSLPHTYTINMQTTQYVDGFGTLIRQGALQVAC